MHITPVRYSLGGLAPKLCVQFTSNKDNISLIDPSKKSELGSRVAENLGVKPTETTVKKFANGETYVCIDENVRHKDVYIMQGDSDNVNDSLMETYLLADAANRAGAKNVYAVMPNFPYARQERKNKDGEPISAKLNMDLLKTAGVDGVITVDLHAPSIEGFADNKMQFNQISSIPAVVKYIKDNEIDNPVVVSPDGGGVKRAEKLAKELGCQTASIDKRRKKHNEAEATTLNGVVDGKNCIIFDDIIDTAGTIAEASKLLKNRGAKNIYVFATHGLFNGPAYERLENSPITEVVVTNTVPLKEGAPEKIKQIDASKEITGAILDFTA